MTVAAVSRFAVFTLLALPVNAAGIELSGHVVDENNTPVAGARVSVTSQEPALRETTLQPAKTGPDGAFRFSLPQPGEYRFTVEREGYYALKDRALRVETNQDITLVVNIVREVFQSQDVNEETSPVDIDQSQNEERLTGTEINAVPFANSHSLRSSLILIPGVVEDRSGTLHVNGSSETQVNYVLNDFNITNPISGQYQADLAVEGIRSVNVLSGQFSPQYGRGSAGVLSIQTENGTDHFHYTATDFFPGLNIQHGMRLGSWYPRFGVSGPIVKGKAWFSDIFDASYTNSLITGLPNGQNTRSGFTGSNLLHTQVNVTPSNIVYADFLVNADNQSRLGLAPLNPVSTTTSLHAHEYFTSIKDQAFFGHGVLLEFGYAHTGLANVQTPQGNGLYVISANGNSGNYFYNARQNASRDEGIVHAYLPKFAFAGAHQIEVGADAEWLRYQGNFNRTGYQVVGLAGQPLSQTNFPFPAAFQVSDTDAAWYALDTWRISQKLQVTAGIRADRDRRIDSTGWSPRVAFSWAPFGSDRTRISGGFALTHDAITMDILGHPLDQVAYTTQYSAAGTPLEPPATTTYAIAGSGLVLPHAKNWNVGVDRQFGERVFVTTKYLGRRGANEFAFENALNPQAPPSLLPLPGADVPGIYQLTNLRRDNYDSFQVAVREKLSGQYEWMVSYTRSQSRSNAVLDAYTAQPLQVLPDLATTPWDAPNRLLAWAYFPLSQNRRLTKNWAVSMLADARSGFPFAVRDQTGAVIGAFDSYRYPFNFDLNLALERMITLRGYRFALRGGIDNLTNQSNPTAVYNVVGSPHFLQFLGDEGRHFVVRIRFFGRAVT